MDRNLDIYDYKRLHSLNGGLSWCKNRVVDVVLLKGTDTLEQKLQEARGGIAGQKVALNADVLLANFSQQHIFDAFRKAEGPLRAAYELFAEAHQKREDARLATKQSMFAWEVPAEDFRLKLKVLGEWAESVALAESRRLWGCDINPYAYMDVVGTSSWLKTPSDFVKYHDSFFREINFIREMCESEFIEGRLGQPVGMSYFETSLKALQEAQTRVEIHQKEENAAGATFESLRRKYAEERCKAFTVLQALSESAQWALFCLVRLEPESPDSP